MGFTARAEFGKAHPSAYRSARTLKIVEDIFPASLRGGKTKWNDSAVREEALKYNSRVEFYRGSASAYNSAKALGILNELFGYQKQQWTKERLRELSKKYQSRIEFYRKDGSAYTTALRIGMMDDLFPVTRGKSPSDYDCVYVWKAVGQFYEGCPVFKIGVTSSRLGEVRIGQVAAASGFEYEVVSIKNSIVKAVLLEKELLSLGKSPKYTGFNGCSEFRAMDDMAFEKAMNLMENWNG